MQFRLQHYKQISISTFFPIVTIQLLNEKEIIKLMSDERKHMSSKKFYLFSALYSTCNIEFVEKSKKKK